MMSGLIYSVVNALSVIAALGGAWCLIVTFIALVTGHKVDKSVLGSAFGFLATAAILYALSDIGARLMRIEEEQQRQKHSAGEKEADNLPD